MSIRIPKESYIGLLHLASWYQNSQMYTVSNWMDGAGSVQSSVWLPKTTGPLLEDMHELLVWLAFFTAYYL